MTTDGLHDDAALRAILADERRSRKAQRRRQALDELTVAEGATTRALAEAAGRHAKGGAVVVGATGMLMVPGLAGQAHAQDAQAPVPAVEVNALDLEIAPAAPAPPVSTANSGEGHGGHAASPPGGARVTVAPVQAAAPAPAGASATAGAVTQSAETVSADAAATSPDADTEDPVQADVADTDAGADAQVEEADASAAEADAPADLDATDAEADVTDAEADVTDAEADVSDAEADAEIAPDADVEIAADAPTVDDGVNTADPGAPSILDDGSDTADDPGQDGDESDLGTGTALPDGPGLDDDGPDGLDGLPEPGPDHEGDDIDITPDADLEVDHDLDVREPSGPPPPPPAATTPTRGDSSPDVDAVSDSTATDDMGVDDVAALTDDDGDDHLGEQSIDDEIDEEVDDEVDDEVDEGVEQDRDPVDAGDIVADTTGGGSSNGSRPGRNTHSPAPSPAVAVPTSPAAQATTPHTTAVQPARPATTKPGSPTSAGRPTVVGSPTSPSGSAGSGTPAAGDGNDAEEVADLPTADRLSARSGATADDPTSSLIDPNDAVGIRSQSARRSVSPRDVNLAGADARTASIQVDDARARPVDDSRVDAWVGTVTRAWGQVVSGSTPNTVIVSTLITDAPTLGASYQLREGETLWHVVVHLWGDAELSPSQLHATLKLLITWNRDVLPADLSASAAGVVIQIPADVAPSA